MRLTVVTYNVRSLRAGADAVASALRPVRPDVLLIQEAGSRRALRRLADELGMTPVSSHRFLNPVRNAVLFAPPWRLVRSQAHALPRTGRSRRRGFIWAELRGSGVHLHAVCAHLGLAGGERRTHAEVVTDFLAGLEGPALLGVDLNEDPDRPAARWMAERLFDAGARAPDGPLNTFPAAAPTARIDYVFVNDRVRPIGCRTVRSDGSDHLPVVAELELETP